MSMTPASDGKRCMVGVKRACERLNESRSYFSKHSLPKLRYYKADRAIRIDDSSIDELVEARLTENSQKPRRGRPHKPEPESLREIESRATT
jgi:hypothetical protein